MFTVKFLSFLSVCSFFVIHQGVFPVTVQASQQVFISQEVANSSNSQANIAAARAEVEALKNNWNNSFVANTNFSTRTFTGSGSLANPSTFDFDNGINIDISLQNMDNQTTGTTHSSGGKLANSTSNTMQDNAPYPSSLVGTPFWNETADSKSSANAILFDFSESVDGFGAWFGDVETRSSSNLAALRLISENGNISNFDILPDDESQCVQTQDSDNGNTTACGNRSTRWIGFRSDTNDKIKQMLVIVGDDDTGTVGDAGTEHLSFIGPTIAIEPKQYENIKQLKNNKNNGTKFINLNDQQKNIVNIIKNTNPQKETNVENNTN